MSILTTNERRVDVYNDPWNRQPNIAKRLSRRALTGKNCMLNLLFYNHTGGLSKYVVLT